MLKAANQFVQVEVANKAVKGFDAGGDSSLFRGKVLSTGINVSNIKKGQIVLFPSVHGKAMMDVEAGKNVWYVDEDIILGFE